MYKTPQQFYDAFNGIGVNRGVGWNDSAFGYQCVAGFKAYCEFEGVPVIPTGNGWADGYWYERFNNGMSQYFEFIEDVSQLRCGDWCIWSRGSSCQDSHIAMYWKGVNGTHAQFFGQNQNGHPYFDVCNIKLDILGAYRLREQPSSNIKMYGIDVSVHNDINLDISTYDYVIIRACWGTNEDTKANQWRLKCESLGIPYGVYMYTYALNVTDAIDEANYICDMVKDWNIQMGVWIDMEMDAYKQEHGVTNPNLISSICQVFCQTVQNRGYYTGIYASQSWFGSMIIGCEEFDKWVASWGTNDGTIQRDTSSMGTMLQYTSYPNLDKDVSYCELEHYRSYPMQEIPAPSEPIEEPIEEPVEEPSEPSQPKPSDDIVIPEMPKDDYLFKMSNKMYDLLKFVTHIIPILITFYVALSDTWKLPYTKEIIATITAFDSMLIAIMNMSTIGYSNKKKGE